MVEHGKGILRQLVDVDRAGAARARADAALVEPDDAKPSLAQRRDDRLPERRRAAEAGDEEEVAALAVDIARRSRRRLPGEGSWRPWLRYRRYEGRSRSPSS